MIRRWLAAGVAVALGLLGCVWYATAPFTITDTVSVDVPEGGASTRQMLIDCRRGAARYVGAAGGPVAQSLDLTSFPDPAFACQASLTDRRVVSMAFIVAGLALAGVAITSGSDEDTKAS